MKIDRKEFKNDILSYALRYFRLIFEIRNKYNDIPIKLPKTTYLMHNGIGIVISGYAKIGECVHIGHNVSIVSKNNKAPVIEDYVIIYPHSIIIGDITIGHHSIIGAGSVIFKSIPPYSLVVEYNQIKKKIDDKYYWNQKGVVIKDD